MTDRQPFEVLRFPHDVIMVRESDHREAVAFYLVPGNRDVAMIDTGLGSGDLPTLGAELSPFRPVVLQTHLHWDHIGASGDFADVRAHPLELAFPRVGWPWDPPGEGAQDDDAEGDPGRQASARWSSGAASPPSGALWHGALINLGGRSLEVIHTPGHSPGSVCFLDREARALFCGDLCYMGQMLLFVSGSNPGDFRNSIQALAAIASAVDAIYPSHGSAPLTGDDLLAVQDAFELVWRGKKADWHGSYAGYPVAIHDFGRFAFLMRPG